MFLNGRNIFLQIIYRLRTINEWIKNGTFNQGIAIMSGKVFNDPVNANAKPLYGIGIDCDNKQAIDIVLETLGYKSISEAAKHISS